MKNFRFNGNVLEWKVIKFPRDRDITVILQLGSLMAQYKGEIEDYEWTDDSLFIVSGS